jgi:hypothetical protein
MFLLAFVLLEKKRTTRKKERKILKTLETVARPDEPAKGLWLKQPPLPPTGTNRHILIHQKTGFANVRYIIQEIQNF